MNDKKARELEALLSTAVKNGLQPDDDDEAVIKLLFDRIDDGVRVAEISTTLSLTKETVRYRLLSLQAAGIVTSRKISRAERRYYLRTQEA